MKNLYSWISANTNTSCALGDNKIDELFFKKYLSLTVKNNNNLGVFLYDTEDIVNELSSISNISPSSNYKHIQFYIKSMFNLIKYQTLFLELEKNYKLLNLNLENLNKYKLFQKELKYTVDDNNNMVSYYDWKDFEKLKNAELKDVKKPKSFLTVSNTNIYSNVASIQEKNLKILEIDSDLNYHILPENQSITRLVRKIIHIILIDNNNFDQSENSNK